MPADDKLFHESATLISIINLHYFVFLKGHSIIDYTFTDFVGCTVEENEETYIIIGWYYAQTFSIFLYNTIDDALEINFTSNFTVLEGYCIRITRDRNGNQEYQQIVLKPNSKFIKLYFIGFYFSHILFVRNNGYFME